MRLKDKIVLVTGATGFIGSHLAGLAFYNVFVFGMNDELVHTGFSAMAHYLIGVGCYRRKEMLDV